VSKVIMVFFLTLSSIVGYGTYTGAGQDSVKTLEKVTVRSNSYHSGSSGSYNSSGYNYGK